MKPEIWVILKNIKTGISIPIIPNSYKQTDEYVEITYYYNSNNPNIPNTLDVTLSEVIIENRDIEVIQTYTIEDWYFLNPKEHGEIWMSLKLK